MTDIKLIDLCVDMDKKAKFDELIPIHGMTLADLLDKALTDFIIDSKRE